MKLFNYILFFFSIFTFSIHAYELPNDSVKNRSIINKIYESDKNIIIKDLDFVPHMDISNLSDKSLFNSLPFSLDLFFREGSTSYVENIAFDLKDDPKNISWFTFHHQWAGVGGFHDECIEPYGNNISKCPIADIVAGYSESSNIKKI